MMLATSGTSQTSNGQAKHIVPDDGAPNYPARSDETITTGIVFPEAPIVARQGYRRTYLLSTKLISPL